MNSNIFQKIPLVLFFCGLIVFTFTTVSNISSISNVAYLPLAYAFSMLLVKKSYENNMGLALIIIEIVKACRYFILPIMISQESLYIGVNLAPGYSETAVLLMCYELLVVSLVMHFYAHKPKLLEPSKKMNSTKVTFMWYFFILFGAFIIVQEPSLRSRLFNFEASFLNELGLRSEIKVNLSGVSRVFFLLGIITTFAYFVRLINVLPISKKIKLILQLVLCTLLVSSLWTNELGSVTRWNMMIGVLLSIYTLLFYYPKSKKRIVFGGLGGVLFVIVIGSALKTLSFGLDDYTVSDSVGVYFSSQAFDEYFQGVRSVSNCILVAEQYNNLNIFEGVMTDWFYSFPFLMRTLELSDLPVATHYYHTVVNQFDLIMPTVSMAFFRFGGFWAPLYSVIAVFFALHFDTILKIEQNILVRLFYIYIVFWFSLFMAISPNVIDPNLWAPFIGIWLIKLEKNIFQKKHI